jgi:hypothetical protein
VNSPPSHVPHGPIPPAGPDRGERLWFLSGLLLLAVVAALGWNNLRYGFGFHDEGMYMADAWRLTVGDNLFPDSFPSILRLFVVFNAAVFALFPDVTLLAFRELQLTLALGAAACMGAAVYRWTGRYGHIPWVMSLFAFSGLQLKGTAPNLSYHTYPHLFFTLYFACLLLGLKASGRPARAAWLLGAGLFLWAAGFSLLPLSAGAVAPVLCWALARWMRVDSVTFTLRDLALVLAPVAVLWAVVLAVYNTAFLESLAAMAGYMTEAKARGIDLDPDAWGYVALGAVFLAGALLAARLPGWGAVGTMAALAAAMGWVVGTNAGGLVPPYYRGFFSRPMWLAGVLIALALVFLAGALRERWRDGRCVAHGGLPFVVLTQWIVLGALFSQVSDSRALSVTSLAIPGAAALGVYLLERLPAAPRPAAAVFLAAFLLPLYGWTAWADWRFTYFDLPPERLTYTIPDGFAAGIRTSPLMGAMVAWIARTAHDLSAPGDRAIFLERAPMGYMIARRRPALNHSWTGLGDSAGLRSDAVTAMVRRGRLPAIAYRFVRAPLFVPGPNPGDPIIGGAPFPYGPFDPISNYLKDHMRLVDTFRVNGKPWIELYVAPPKAGAAP